MSAAVPTTSDARTAPVVVAGSAAQADDADDRHARYNRYLADLAAEEAGEPRP
jgi:hypothetical protein